MKPSHPNLTKFKSTIRQMVLEVLANKFGQGGNVDEAQRVANSVWGGVYNVMPNGEGNNNVFYRITLHSSSGPVKYLKQDSLGRWFSMNPPQRIWRPVDQSKVATEPKTETPVHECDECGSCGDEENKDAMKGDTTDVHTMDAVNVAESIDYIASSMDVAEAYREWKKVSRRYTDNPSSVSFVSGWNAALAHLKKVGLNEMTGTSAVAGYQTPYAFSKKKTGSQKALDATKKIGYKPTKKEY